VTVDLRLLWQVMQRDSRAFYMTLEDSGVGNYFRLGATLRRPRLAEGRTSLSEKKQVSVYSLSTNIYYEKLEKILYLKIFLNASAGH